MHLALYILQTPEEIFVNLFFSLLSDSLAKIFFSVQQLFFPQGELIGQFHSSKSSSQSTPSKFELDI